MIADIVLGIWLVMAAIYGWKRKALLELNSVMMFAISYLIARVAAGFAAPSLAGIKISGATLGPIGAEALASFVLWLTLYILLSLLWRKFKPSGPESGIRIEVDAQGQPIAKSTTLKSLFGALFGMIHGTMLYAAILLWCMLLVPIISYKDGKGITMIHPGSHVIKVLRMVDPLLQRIDWSVKGLRSLRFYNQHRKVRRKAHRDKSLRKAVQSKPIKKLRRNSKLLSRANSSKQGRRDGTLLLWMPAFQKLVADPKTAKELKHIAKALPAPFDGGTKAPTKKRRKR